MAATGSNPGYIRRLSVEDPAEGEGSFFEWRLRLGIVHLIFIVGAGGGRALLAVATTTTCVQPLTPQHVS